MSHHPFHIPAAPVLLPLWVIGVGLAVGWLAQHRILTLGRAVTVLASATYVVAVLALTLFPLQVALPPYGNEAAWYDKVNLIPVLTIDPATFILNIVMTVPLGVLAPLLVRVPTRGRAALVGLVVSAGIEIVQAFTNIAFSSGRTGDVNDLIANTLGAVLGWSLYRWVQTSAWAGRFMACLTVRAARPAAR